MQNVPSLWIDVHYTDIYSVSPIQRRCTWWRQQMETFSVLLALCAGNSPVTGEFPSERPVTQSFDIFFDLCLNKQLSKQSWGWWFEMPSHPLWCHCNDVPSSGVEGYYLPFLAANLLEIMCGLVVTNPTRIRDGTFIQTPRELKLLSRQGSFCICSQPMRDDIAM